MANLETLVFDDVDAIEKVNRKSFDQNCYETFRLSCTQARLYRANYVGTEHLLLGLAREDNRKLFEDANIELSKVRPAVEFVLPQFHPTVHIQDLGLTPRSKTVLFYAADSAGNNLSISHPHLLLGLFKERRGIASAVLEGLGAKFNLPTKPVEKSKKEGETVFSHFNEASRQVLALAGKASQEFGHEMIGTEHLLLGLSQSPELKIPLQEVGCSEEILLGAIKKIGVGASEKLDRLNMTPTMRKVITLARQLVKDEQSLEVTPIHLLRGLLRYGLGNFTAVLEEIGIPKTKYKELEWKVFSALAELNKPPDLEFIESKVGPRIKTSITKLDQLVLQELRFNSQQHFDWYRSRLSAMDQTTLDVAIKIYIEENSLDIDKTLQDQDISLLDRLWLTQRLSALIKNWRRENP